MRFHGRRHPSAVLLGAWFDGECDAGVGSHVSACERCRRHLDDLALVRGAVRGTVRRPRSPAATPGSAVTRTTRRGRAGRRVRINAPLVLAASAVVVALASGPLRAPIESARTLLVSGGHPNHQASGSPSATVVSLDTPKVARARSGRPGQAASFPPDSVVRAVPGPVALSSRSLRLGIIVPTTGPLAVEGEAVIRAVMEAIDGANAAGGIGGHPVQLQVIPAEPATAIATAVRHVDALVGGFGTAAAPTSTLWFLPADPWLSGADVVQGEPSAERAGRALGTDLRHRDSHATVGVVVDSGPDARLAEGLASQVRTLRISTTDDSLCDREVVSLRTSGVDTLAIAGAPELALRCAAAAARIGWHPSGGLLVAPSTAYLTSGASWTTAPPGATPPKAPAASVGPTSSTTQPASPGGSSSGSAQPAPGPPSSPSEAPAPPDEQKLLAGARTVLDFPWPTWNDPGAARFRATTGSTSYRALVSFAAVDFTVSVARETGTLSLRAVREGSWQSDLFGFEGTTPSTDTVVEAGPGGWSPASA